MKKLILPLCALCLIAAPASAATISVNFTNNGEADSVMDAADVAGASAVAGARVSGWNNVLANGAIQAPVALTSDSAGSSIATMVGYSGALGSWTLSHAIEGSDQGDDRMWKGYLDADNAVVNVTNVPYTSYNLVVYFDGDNAGNWRVASYTIGGVTLSAEDSEGADWGIGRNPNGAYQLPIGGGTGNADYGTLAPGEGNNGEGNYVVFTGLTGSSFDLVTDGTGGGDDNNRAPINGFQIIAIPEPGTAVLLGLGAVSLLRRSRRRA